MFKVNDKDLRSRSGVFIVSVEHISHLVLGFLLLTLNIYLPAGLWYQSSDMFLRAT